MRSARATCAYCGEPTALVLVYGKLAHKRYCAGRRCRDAAHRAGKGNRRDDLRPESIDAIFRFAKARQQYRRRVAS